MSQILLILAAFALLVGLPAAIIWTFVDYLRHPGRESRGGGAALGAALQELDKLVARPSIEYVEEAKTKIVEQDADSGDQ